MIQPISAARLLVAAAVTSLLFVTAAFPDPLHRFHKQDGYWHHGSGWVFNSTIGAFKLAAGPYQIAGNDDIGAEYAMESNGARRTAVVGVYYPSSAEPYANFAAAKAFVQKSTHSDACTPSQSEGKFAIARRPEIAGLKVSFVPSATKGCAQASLYFFQTADWVISVHTTAPASDADAAKALDELVRALRWETLGTDPLLHDSTP